MLLLLGVFLSVVGIGVATYSAVRLRHRLAWVIVAVNTLAANIRWFGLCWFTGCVRPQVKPAHQRAAAQPTRCTGRHRETFSTRRPPLSIGSAVAPAGAFRGWRR